MSKDGRHINITSKDTEYLALIKQVLGLNILIGKKNSSTEKEKKYSVLQFSDANFYKYMESIGLFHKKSLTLGKILVPAEYFKDFLSGVIDGDGCISTWVHKSNGRQQWPLRITSAAPVFISWLKEETERVFDVKGKLYTYSCEYKKNPIHILKFGKFAGKVIINQTYYKACLCLERKDVKGKLCLQDTNRMVNYGNVMGPGAVTGSQN